jgi:Protein of unknown function (DUF2934)
MEYCCDQRYWRKPVSGVHDEPANLPANIGESIRRRAFELYEERGRKDGDKLKDWLRAEEQIMQQKTRTML